MTSIQGLKGELRFLLEGGNAHCSFDAAVANLPEDLRGRRPAGLPYSPWELVEHMRRAQEDIVKFVQNPDYESPSWPDGYWPDNPSPPDREAWERSIEQFLEDRKAMLGIIDEASGDLSAPIRGGEPQSILREAQLIADHTAYHLGQLIVVRRLLGAWIP